MRIYFLTRQRVFAESLKFYLQHIYPDWIFEFSAYDKPTENFDICLVDMMDFTDPVCDAEKIINAVQVMPATCLLGRRDLTSMLQRHVKIKYSFPADIPARKLFGILQDIYMGVDCETIYQFDKTLQSDMPDFSSLTAREKEVLQYLKQGASNKEIANSLSIEVVTVKLHVRGICRKLNVVNRTQAALLAQKWGV